MRLNLLAIVVAAGLSGGLGWADVTTTPIDGGSSSAPAATPTANTSNAPVAPADLTPEKAHALADSGQYREALKILLRLLSMQGNASIPDHAGLLLLRGECQLQVHEPASAVESLQAAAKEATANGNVDESSQALALLLLNQKAVGGKYTPVVGTSHKPLNIMDKEERKQAYSALLADLLALDQQKLRAATASSSIAPLLETVKGFTNLHAVERVVTGATKACDAFAKDAGATASKLIGTTLTEYDQKVSRISSAAEQLVRDTFGGTFTQMHRAGLTSEEASQLRDIIAACKKVGPAVDALNEAFSSSDQLGRLSGRADTVRDHATAALNKNYR